MEFPILAGLLNAFLSALNQVRILPMLSNRTAVMEEFSKSLTTAVDTVKKLGLDYENDWPDAKRQEFERMGQLLLDVFIPQVTAGLEAVYDLPLESPLDKDLNDESLIRWATNSRKRMHSNYAATTYNEPVTFEAIHRT